MSNLDWAVLLGTLAAVIGWGLWKERRAVTAEVYLRGERDLRWWTVGLSVMATQASAITFLSMPGQAYEDGLGFVQFYFGLPVAMVLLSAFVLPSYFGLGVHTAYEFLEGRFDRKTRQLTALLFLLSRGLAAGVSIYAPAIVLSAVLGWPLQLTNLVIGVVVILYTVSGGTQIVSRTQTLQMTVILAGMTAAGFFLWSQLPASLTLDHAAHLAGALGRMKAVDFSVRLDTRYTIWSGLTGGLFVQLAYFGTDQSQVQRYLGGASLTESRLGLLMNGLVKVPLQALILAVGVLLFVFHQFQQAPVYFDEGQWRRVEHGEQAAAAQAVDTAWGEAFAERRLKVDAYVDALAAGDPARLESARGDLQAAQKMSDAVRSRAKALVAEAFPGRDARDSDYIFIGYVVSHFPAGLVGLLLAVILCAAMSAVAAALNSLGATTVVDFYRPWLDPSGESKHELAVAKGATVFWGIVALLFAVFAAHLENLIQAVNILGSLFYGPMLGVFIVGFFLKKVRGTAAFWATVAGEALVVAAWLGTGVGFLWYNVIGCGAVVVLALALELVLPRPRTA
jgi:SSS family transporter